MQQDQHSEATSAPGATGERTTRRRLSTFRRTIAARLKAAQQQAVILTTFNECDMSELIRLRAELQDEFVRVHGFKLGFMPFFIKACVSALQAVPAINGHIDGEDFVQNHYFDVGIAVDTPRGLMVPVIREPERKSLAQLERTIDELAHRAREGGLRRDELEGGVFSISNGGVFGSLLSTPILNPPQSGILGMHKIQERPVARDGQVVIRPMMNLALSYDHRVVDGREAVTFLVHIKECIENPMRSLFAM